MLAFTPSQKPSTLCQQTGQLCRVPIVGRQDKCANCSHIRQEQYNAQSLIPISRRQEGPCKADSDLTAIGSHLFPPAYSVVDSRSKPEVGIQPETSPAGVESEQTVFNLVISQNQSHGDDPVQRFIKDSPSTFDRIQEPVRGYNSKWFNSNIEPDIHNRAPQHDPDVISAVFSEDYPGNKRLKLDDNHCQVPSDKCGIQANRRPNHRNSRQRISARSQQTIRRPQVEMRKFQSTQRTPTPSGVTGSHELSCFPCHQQQAPSAAYSAESNGDATVGAFRSRATARMSRAVSMGTAYPDSSYDVHHSAAEEDENGTDRPPSPLDLSSSHRPTAYAAFQHHHIRPTEGGEMVALLSPSRSPSPSTSPRARPVYRRSDEAVYSSGNNAASDDYMGYTGGGLIFGHSPKEPNLFYGRHSNAWLFNNISVRDSIKKGYHHFTHKGNTGGNGNGGARSEEGGEE